MKLILRGRRFGFSLEDIRQWLMIYGEKGTLEQYVSGSTWPTASLSCWTSKGRSWKARYATCARCATRPPVWSNRWAQIPSRKDRLTQKVLNFVYILDHGIV